LLNKRQEGNYYNLEINIPFCFCLIAWKRAPEGGARRGTTNAQAG
jgi:hypothetical protein